MTVRRPVARPVEVEDAPAEWVPGCAHRFVVCGDLRMHVVTMGPENGKPVVLLHGFPELWYGWRFQMPALAEAGYRVIVPDQRGYNLTGKEGPFDLGTLTGDIARLQDALGVAKSHVVGHDWGAAVAYTFAAAYPERTDRLAIVNGPHPRLYVRAVRRRPAQLLRSWYYAFFLIPQLPEKLLAARSFGGIDSVFRLFGARMSDEDLRRYEQSAEQHGALHAMLGWYRAGFEDARRRPRRRSRVERPTMVVWGGRDPILTDACNAGLDKLVPDLRVERLPDAGHFAHHEKPDEVNRLLLELFAP